MARADSSGIGRCRVVLVRPHIAGNLGATARVMKNFGLEDLVLVAPVADRDDREARQMSTHGESILDEARIVDELGEAVADRVLVVATSARTGGLFRRQSMGPPSAIVPHLALALAEQQPAALVFGPEPTGLTNEEISRCHYLIHIPTDEAYPALNLAQAVAICLYELRTLWDERAAPVADAPALATFDAQEHMFARLREALEEVHFLYGPKADPLMHGIRHLLTKARLSPMEVQLLLGLARQLHWFAQQSSPPPNQP